ncbi:radical SAM protein [Candidatus Magnetobacterium bavaricum]|uniref:Radical SAM protein n=1 Tax=Candidatus Magnetobacterium bavaricum TaxID=29290 RepID=A0A0F3GHN2_9BACT|nr:radical SAM protein [Candidatus Magnetobacterium bavaricum]
MINGNIMEDIFIDSSILRKKNTVKTNLRFVDTVPIFSIVEFNIFDTCNRKCAFCPNSNKTRDNKQNKKIDISLYTKTMKDLSRISFNGKILYSAFSEPLLNNEIEKLITISKEILQDCTVEMVSNGDLLNVDKLIQLFESGLDAINISLYDGPEQIEHFNKMQENVGLHRDKIILRRRYLADDNYGMTISNRAGLVDSNKYRAIHDNPIEHLPLDRECYYPFYMILIDLNGDVLLCPHDWSKKLVLGNVDRENIWEIWNNDILKKIRLMLVNNNRNFSPCIKCDVYGNLIGRESFEAWQNYYNLS